MLNNEKTKQLVLGIFEEEALVLGGFVAVHKFKDEIVWGLIRNMDAILRKTMKSLDQETRAHPPTTKARTDYTPHPAIEEFLSRIRSS